MVENPNLSPNNALFNGMSDFHNSDTCMPVLTPIGQKHENPRENHGCHDTGKYIGGESPPCTIHRPLRASTPVTNTRVFTTHMHKFSLWKFNGYSHEDATKFLDEFSSYCVFHKLNASEQRKIAAFHFHRLCGLVSFRRSLVITFGSQTYHRVGHVWITSPDSLTISWHNNWLFISCQ